jgi:hypothetical protein
MSIHFLNHHEIDISAWDKCIASSFNGTINAFSWYLDLACENWGALIEDNYQSVMPLPVRRFLGKDIIFLPCPLNELGIFSITPINSQKTKAFIEAIPHRFPYYRIVLNKYNPLDQKDIKFITQPRYELDLIKPYYKIAGGFTPDTKQKLNHAMARNFSFITGMSPNDLIRFIIEKKIRLPRPMMNNHFKLTRSLIAGLMQYKSGELYGVYDNHNELASAALFAGNNSRINLIFQVVATDKMIDYAHFFLIDRFVNKYAETNTTLTLDSSIKYLSALPYKDFGACETHHAELMRNLLPFPLNFFVHSPIFTTFF